MGDHRNLNSNEAIQKIKDLVKAADVCHFITALSHAPLSTRPMSTQQVDDDGNLWFMSEKSSEKNLHIGQDSKVQLLYSHHSGSEYLSIHGIAEVLYDRQKVEELWTPILKTWFQQGKDDPELTLIKVTPDDAYYWDTKNNKMVALIKMLTSVVVGKTMDDGIEGSLTV